MLTFETVVDAHYANLFRFALSLARNSADAADLTQQTFFIWAKKGHLLRDPAKVKSWLFTTLYREFLKQHRRSATFTTLEASFHEDDPPRVEPDQFLRVDAELVLQALLEVDEIYRAPLTLFYLDDLSYKEIASVLEIPIGTVMSRLSRGKTQLRTAFTRERNPSGSKVIPIGQPGSAHHG